MTKEELISSGIIESYVLGVASKKDSMLVEAMSTDIDVRLLLDQYQQSLEKYLLHFSAAPNEAVKSRLFDQIQMQSPTQELEFTPAQEDYKPSRYYLTAAASIMLACSILMHLYQYQKIQDMKTALALQTTQNQVLSQDYLLNKTNLDDLKNRFAIINKPGVATLDLQGLPIAPTAHARLHYNKLTHEVFLSANALPAPPTGKQYQVWGIVDNVPVSAGLIKLSAGKNEFLQLDTIKPVQAFAISLEPLGGSATPTKEAIYAIGYI